MAYRFGLMVASLGCASACMVGSGGEVEPDRVDRAPGESPLPGTSHDVPRGDRPVGAMFPVATEVGLRDASVLQPRTGIVTIKDDGAVVENLDIRGRLHIQANNVTVRNCRVDGQGYEGGAVAVITTSSITGLTIEHVEIHNARVALALGAQQGSRLRGGANANQLRDLYIHDVGDGIHIGSDFTLAHSYIATKHWVGNHSDGVQISNRGNAKIVTTSIHVGLGVAATDDAATNMNAAVFLAQDFPETITNVEVRDSFLDGGGHVYRHWKPAAKAGFETPQASVVRDSWFGRGAIWDTAVAYPGRDGSPQWENNRYLDTGKADGAAPEVELKRIGG